MKKILAFLTVLSSYWVSAQSPNWSVTPSNYNYSMNVTAVLSENCVELTNPSNEIGAFIGSECVGSDYTLQVVNGRYIAFLTVYSNNISGDNISFKFYNASSNQIQDAYTEILFQHNAVYGFVTAPFDISNIDKPTDITISSSSITENLKNTEVGILEAVNQSGNNFSYTFELTSGVGDDDNSKFRINGDKLLTDDSLNFEQKTSYTIRLKTSDGNCSFEKSFTITVSNANDFPTNILLSSLTVTENNMLGDLIGNLSSSDEDASDLHSYSLVSGNGSTDNSSFSINNNKLLTNDIFNFEIKNQYSIRLRTTDSDGGFYEKEFVINISDENEVPTNILLDTTWFDENLSMGTEIIQFSTEDEDVMDTHIYTLENSQASDNNLFTIIGDKLLTNSYFDFESNAFYTIRIKTTDNNGLDFTKQFQLQVNDKNDAPTDLMLNNRSVNENASINSLISLLSTTDEDALDSHNYSFVSGSGDMDNNSFSISGDSILLNTSLDINVKSEYYIHLRATDLEGDFYEKEDTIFVKNSNDPPTDVFLSANLVDENNNIETLVGILSTEDADVNDGHTYNFIQGNGDEGNAFFQIKNNNELWTNESFNFEVKSNYDIRLQAADYFGDSFNKEFIINIKDINEKPVINDTTFYISEDISLDALIGVIDFEDEDQNDVHLFSVVNNEYYCLNNELFNAREHDYETENQYSFDVIISDIGDLKDTSTITIVVNDVIENDSPLAVNEVITPNDDGKNDFFTIQNVELYEDYSLKVFNNSGFIIYEVKNGYDNTWGATYKDSKVEQGVYYYLLQNNQNSSEYFKGTISVIR